MMRRKLDIATLTVTIISAAVLLTVILGVFVFDGEIGGGPEVTTKEKEISFPDVPAVPVREEITVSYDIADLSDKYERDGEERFISEVGYPVFEGGIAEATERINAYIYAFASERVTVKSYEKDKADAKYEMSLRDGISFIPLEYVTTVRSVYVKDGFVSVLFSQTKTVGMTEPAIIYTSMLFDLESGDLSDISAFMNSTKEVAMSFILDIFSQHIEINLKLYYSDALQILPDVFNIEDIYLTEEGAVLYIPADTIAPSVYGIMEFTVPYNKLGH